MGLRRSTFAAACFALLAAAIPLGTTPTAAAPRPSQTQAGGRGRGSVITLQPATPPAVGSGTISGVVIDGATRKPVAGALVQLTGGPDGGLVELAGRRPRQMTDASGRFVFTRLPAPADYCVVAQHPDYLGASYNVPPGEPCARIALGEAQWFPNANIQLFKPAALSGTVVDERGVPVVGVAVIDVEGEEWRNVSFLESLLATSVPVVVKDGATTRQDLRIQ